MIRQNISFLRFIRYSVSIALILSSVYLHADVPASRKPTEFYFARLMYTVRDGDTSIKGWYTDTPNMDDNLVAILNRVTGISADTKTVSVTSEIFKSPFLYSVEPEQIVFTAKEAALMHEWLARGGTWFADDYHGDVELADFDRTVRQVWPNVDREELTPQHPIFHVFYNIDRFIQVVNDQINACRPDCDQWENGPSGIQPKFFAYYDRENPDHIMVLAAANTDLGDGLEWMSDPNYPFEQSVYAMKVVTNVVIWALSH